MKPARGEELRLAILRTNGRCAIRAYKEGVGFTNCGAPATLAVVTRGAMADATCDVHYRALTGVTP
jgi:hypothetical protein